MALDLGKNWSLSQNSPLSQIIMSYMDSLQMESTNSFVLLSRVTVVTVTGAGDLYRTGLYIQQYFLHVRVGEETATMYCRMIEISVISLLQNVLKIVNIFLSKK